MTLNEVWIITAEKFIIFKVVSTLGGWTAKCSPYLVFLSSVFPAHLTLWPWNWTFK